MRETLLPRPTLTWLCARARECPGAGGAWEEGGDEAAGNSEPFPLSPEAAQGGGQDSERRVLAGLLCGMGKLLSLAEPQAGGPGRK